MLLRLLYLCLGSFLFFSCQKDVAGDTVNSTADHGLYRFQIAKSKNLKPQLLLTPAAKENVSNWPVYQAISKHIDTLDNPSLNDLRATTSYLINEFNNVEQIQDAKISQTPEKLKTAPILSRLLVVETQVRVLQDLVNEGQPDTTQITEEIIRLKNAYQDLNLQINERFAKSIEELLKELNETQENDPKSEPSKAATTVNQETSFVRKDTLIRSAPQLKDTLKNKEL